MAAGPPRVRPRAYRALRWRGPDGARIRAIADSTAHSSHASPPPGTTTLPLRQGPVARLLLAALAGAAMLPAVVYPLVGDAPAALTVALTAYLAAAALSAALMRRGYPHRDLGLCNLVTLARLVLASALLAPLVGPGAAGPIVAVALLALMLDGVDGWLARRQGRESAFGARFDMEVDAAFGLVLAVNALAAGHAGPGVLLLGLPRYLFAAAARRWSWLARPLPERLGRKIVCVLQITVLIALQVPTLASALAPALVSATLALLGWSFGRDVAWLWRARS